MWFRVMLFIIAFILVGPFSSTVSYSDDFATVIAKADTAKKSKAKKAETQKAKTKKTAKKKSSAKKTTTKKSATKKKPRPPRIAAKKLFGFVLSSAKMKAKSIGFYTRGCLAGGKSLAVDGPAWQAMRLSRNRNWGHPLLVSYVEKLAKAVRKEDGWPGLLVGDLSQPRGGPMLSGHRSHQIGLDADVWLNPMPKRRFTNKEREEVSAVSMLDKTGLKVNPKVWTSNHVKVIKRAASFKEVARVLVHPAIKKALCKASGDDKAWLYKIRPWYGHHYHMHIRLNCPKGVKGCKNQPAPGKAAGCGKQLDYWFALLKRTRKPRCDYGTLARKDKKWICNCPKNLTRVAIGKKGAAKCVLEDGTLPVPKYVKKDLNWMPKACHPVLKQGNPPLWKARKLGTDIEQPIRKAIADNVVMKEAVVQKAVVETPTKVEEPDKEKAVEKSTPEKSIESLIKKTIDPNTPIN